MKMVTRISTGLKKYLPFVSKLFAGIHAFAEAFDLQQPIWLDKNINEFKRVDKTRFEQDNFIEQIDFDYLEIEVIEE